MTDEAMTALLKKAMADAKAETLIQERLCNLFWFPRHVWCKWARKAILTIDGKRMDVQERECGFCGKIERTVVG